MNKRTIGSILSIVAITALTIGCGSSSASKKETTGIVIDDYIKGATVCGDVNRDGKRDSGDTPCVTTNNFGQFKFASDVSASPLVMSGGTDVGTDKVFTGTLTAPAGSTVINPLTTIVQAIVKSGKSVAEAQAIVIKKLNLPDVDLATYDPIATLEDGTDTEKEEAKKVFAQQSSIQTILTTVAKTIAAAVSGSDEDDVTQAVASQIATLLTVATTKTVDVAAKAKEIITKTAEAEIPAGQAQENVKAIAVAVAAQVEAASDKVVESIEAIDTTDAKASVKIRTAAVKVATVTADNSDEIKEALSADTVDADAIIAAVEEDTSNLPTDVVAVTVTTDLTTVATAETAPEEPTVTGAEGGN